MEAPREAGKAGVLDDAKAARRRSLRGAVVPGYVHACAHGHWHLRLWKRGTFPDAAGKAIRARYRCRSWRHPGRCAVERSQEDFARIRAALTTADPQHVVFSVLTFNQGEWEDEQEAYEHLRDCWRSFAKAIRREFGPMKYVSTVEKTRRGWPHLNVIMSSPGLGGELATVPKYVRQWFKDHADACGFGYIASVEVARSAEQIAGYVVKLADLASVGDAPAPAPGVASETVGEVVKLSQLPRNARKGFRRLRASPGFLPKVKPESEYTGELERVPHPEDMTPEQRDALLRWEQSLEEQRARFAAWDALTPEQRAEHERRYKPRHWDRMDKPPARVVIDWTGDTGPNGEELFDGDRTGLVRLRGLFYTREELTGVRPEEAGQMEFF